MIDDKYTEIAFTPDKSSDKTVPIENVTEIKLDRFEFTNETWNHNFDPNATAWPPKKVVVKTSLNRSLCPDPVKELKRRKMARKRRR